MAKTTAQIREEQRKKNVELGLLPQEKDVSELYGAKSFDGREVLPGEKSGETKAREDRFRGHVYDWRKDPGYQDLIEGKGAKVSDIPAIEQSYLEKYPNVPTGNSAIKTEGLSDYNPPKASSTATGVQNQLRKALYDISYLKDSLGASMNETESVRKGVGAGQEQSVVDQERSKVRKKGEDFGITTDRAEGGKTIANPEFTKLSTNQQILNAQRKANGESFIPESISAESGRAPIKDKLSKENRLSAQQLSQTVNTLGDKSLDVLSANFDLLSPSQKAAARDYMNVKAQARAEALVQEISQNVKEELTIQEQKIRADLNMSPEDVLTFTDDGEPLINKKTVTQDATDRAKEDVQEAKDDWLETNGEAQENELARITAANTVNGNLTDDGRAELAEQARKYKKIKDDKFKSIDDDLRVFENKQKSAQAGIDLAVAKGNSVEGKLNRKLAQDQATGAFNIQKEQARIGSTIGFTAAIAEYKKREKEAIKDPKYADIAKGLDSKIFTEGFDRSTTLETAVSAFSNNVSNAEKYMKERGFTARDVQQQKEAFQIDVLGYDDETMGLTKLNIQKRDILEDGGQNDGSDVYQYIKGLKKDFSGTTAGDKIVKAALLELQDSPNLKTAGRIVVEDELSDLEGVSILGGGDEAGGTTFAPQFENLLDSAVAGFISETEFGKAIKDLPDAQQRALITEKGRRFGGSKGTPEEQRIITQVMRQLPTKLKDAILEKRERQKEILADVRRGRGVQDIVDELKGFIVVNNDQIDLAKYLRVKVATAPDFELANISAPINLNSPMGAITAVENALLPEVESEFSQASTDAILRTSDEIIGLIDDVGDKFMGRFDKIKFEAGKATIPDSVFKGLNFDQIQVDKAQRLASRMAKLMAVDRRAFGGTAVTETELEQLRPFLVSMADQPRTARSVLSALSEDALLRHNAGRRQKGLPTLDDAETFLNDDLKLRVYENSALVPRLEEAGFNNQTIDLFKEATPEQRRQVLDLIDTKEDIQGEQKKNSTVGGKFERIEPDETFNTSVNDVSDRLGINPESFIRAMNIETAGTLNPAIQNPHGSASGMIQFTASTAKALGTTIEEIRKLPREGQVELAGEYFEMKAKAHGFNTSDLQTPEDVYMAIAAPDGVGDPDSRILFKKDSNEWDVNELWRPKNGGDITVGSIKEFVRNSQFNQSPQFNQNILASRTNAVRDLISQGVKDPSKILNFLNFNEEGEEIGDFTLSEVKKIISKESNQNA